MGTHLLIALAIAFAPPAIAQSDGQSQQPAIAADNYSYQLFLPRGYNADPQANWPLLLFLHGSGERGDDVANAKVHGPPNIHNTSAENPVGKESEGTGRSQG